MLSRNPPERVMGGMISFLTREHQGAIGIEGTHVFGIDSPRNVARSYLVEGLIRANEIPADD